MNGENASVQEKVDNSVTSFRCKVVIASPNKGNAVTAFLMNGENTSLPEKVNHAVTTCRTEFLCNPMTTSKTRTLCNPGTASQNTGNAVTVLPMIRRNAALKEKRENLRSQNLRNPVTTRDRNFHNHVAALQKI